MIKPHLCKFCNTTNPVNFYTGSKSTCKTCFNNNRKQFYAANPEIRKEKDDKYYYKTRNLRKELSKERSMRYYKANKEIVNAKSNARFKSRRKIDPLYAMRSNLRSSLLAAFKKVGAKKIVSVEQILGCSFNYFKTYLESKFEPWMTWENRGLYNGTEEYGWDIDHIIPVSTAATKDDVIKLNHYTNLQPLCSYKNRVIKLNKIQEYNLFKNALKEL